MEFFWHDENFYSFSTGTWSVEFFNLVGNHVVEVSRLPSIITANIFDQNNWNKVKNSISLSFPVKY